MVDFIAFDWCGWNQHYGRFTHVQSGITIVCKPYYDQKQWDQAQLTFFKQFPPNIPVYECIGEYNTTGKLLGTVENIIKRLEERLKPLG